MPLERVAGAALHQLDGHLLADFSIHALRPEHRAHAAAADQLHQLIGTAAPRLHIRGRVGQRVRRQFRYGRLQRVARKRVMREQRFDFPPDGRVNGVRSEIRLPRGGVPVGKLLEETFHFRAHARSPASSRRSQARPKRIWRRTS